MRNTIKFSVLSLAFSLTLSAAATANSQAVYAEKNMSLELANQIASASVTACAGNGYAVAARWLTVRAPCAPCSAPTTQARTRWLPASKRRSLLRRPRTPH